MPGPPSHVLRPRTEDLGASWPAHAYRCRQELPAQLAWAAPLLDPTHPMTVSCRHDQARQLIVWNNRLPTCQQTSFSCERLSPDAAHHGPLATTHAGRREAPRRGRIEPRPVPTQAKGVLE